MRKRPSIARAACASALLLGWLSTGAGCEAATDPNAGAGGASTADPGAGGAGGTTASGGAGGASTTTSSTTPGAGGAGGSPHLDCKQKYTSIQGGACDLLNQDCDLGQTCRPWSLAGGAYTTKCLTNSGLKSRGAVCTGDAECEAHLFCTGNTNSPGQCAPACCPDADEPCGGGKCNLTVSLGAADFVYLCTYLTACTLLTKDACPKGEDCHLQDSKEGYAACVAPSGSNVPEGGKCAFINDCGDMQLCAQGLCRYNCYVGAAGEGVAPGLGGCPAGQVCGESKTGIAGVGVCHP